LAFPGNTHLVMLWFGKLCPNVWVLCIINIYFPEWSCGEMWMSIYWLVNSWLISRLMVSVYSVMNKSFQLGWNLMTSMTVSWLRQVILIIQSRICYRFSSLLASETQISVMRVSFFTFDRTPLMSSQLPDYMFLARKPRRMSSHILSAFYFSNLRTKAPLFLRSSQTGLISSLKR
jgi:hypothetical protein